MAGRAARAGGRFAGRVPGGRARGGVAGRAAEWRVKGTAAPEALCGHSRPTCLSVTTCHAYRRTPNYVVATTT